MTPEHDVTYLEAINECVNEAIDKEDFPFRPDDNFWPVVLLMFATLFDRTQDEIQEETNE